MVAPPATRRPDPRHIGTPLPAPFLCSAVPPGGSRAHRRAPDRRSILSIPRTPPFRTCLPEARSPHVRGRWDDRCGGRTGRRGPGRRHPWRPGCHHCARHGPGRARRHRHTPAGPDLPGPAGQQPGRRRFPRLAAGRRRISGDRLRPGHPGLRPGRRRRGTGPVREIQHGPTAQPRPRRPTRPRPGTGPTWPAPGTPGHARHPPCTGGSAPPSTRWSSTGCPAGGSARTRPTSW